MRAQPACAAAALRFELLESRTLRAFDIDPVSGAAIDRAFGLHHDAGDHAPCVKDAHVAHVAAVEEILRCRVQSIAEQRSQLFVSACFGRDHWRGRPRDTRRRVLERCDGARNRKCILRSCQWQSNARISLPASVGGIFAQIADDACLPGMLLRYIRRFLVVEVADVTLAYALEVKRPHGRKVGLSVGLRPH